MKFYLLAILTQLLTGTAVFAQNSAPDYVPVNIRLAEKPR